MHHARRFATIATVLACISAVAACGGGGHTKTTGSGQDDVIAYRPGVNLDVLRTKTEVQGPVRVEWLEYSSVDGQRVPALFAVPTDKPPLGCVVFVPGFGSPKEALPELRAGLARLRLATFSIDARNVGARGGPAEAIAAVKKPEGVRSMMLDTVTDLRVGLDYLDDRRDCRHNIAVLGISFGGAVATHLAAQDHRIKAAVLTSIGATFKQTILQQPEAAKSVPGLPSYADSAAHDPAALAHAVKVLGPYDLDRWIGRISPRPVMLINGRFDPLVAPGDALQLAQAARSPKSVLYFNGGHDPFADGPDKDKVSVKATKFLLDSLHLPTPAF